MKIDFNWWDYNKIGSLFYDLYEEGDDSKEGYLLDKELSLKERTIREVDMIVSYAGINKKSKILDIPCGKGRHVLNLIERGYNATGVDLNHYYIECARSKITNIEENENTFLVDDMRSFSINTKFDLIINMFLSFGFFNDDGNISMIKSLYSLLKPKGKLFIHTDVNPIKIYRQEYRDRTIRFLKSGNTLIIDEYYNINNKRLEGNWSIINSKKILKTANYSVRIYSHEEMKILLKSVGFKNIDILPVDGKLTTAQDIIYIGEKS